jgi:hypothetical protein
MRSGDTNKELAIYYSISGTASNGVDYSELNGIGAFCGWFNV